MNQHKYVQTIPVKAELVKTESVLMNLLSWKHLFKIAIVQKRFQMAKTNIFQVYLLGLPSARSFKSDY